MAIRLPGMLMQAKQILCRSVSGAKQAGSGSVNVPSGYFPVYVGECQKSRYLVPVSYFNQPIFQEFLSKAEEEFGFSYPMGCLTIPCREDIFIDLTSRLNQSQERRLMI